MGGVARGCMGMIEVFKAEADFASDCSANISSGQAKQIEGQKRDS
jgi:hypothetical protein